MQKTMPSSLPIPLPELWLLIIPNSIWKPRNMAVMWDLFKRKIPLMLRTGPWNSYLKMEKLKLRINDYIYRKYCKNKVPGFFCQRYGVPNGGCTHPSGRFQLGR